MAPKKGIIIILDTNFLLIPARFKIDIFDEIDRLFDGIAIPAITRAILEEIEIIKSSAKHELANDLDLALELAKKCVIIEEKREDDENVDEHIVRVSIKHKYLVATTDNNLRKILRTYGVSVVYLRKKSNLEIDGIKPF